MPIGKKSDVIFQSEPLTTARLRFPWPYVCRNGGGIDGQYIGNLQ